MKKFTFLLTILVVLLLSTFCSFAGDIKGKVTAKGVKTSADALIYIEKIPGKTFELPKEHPVMNQKNLVFIPHILPVLVGTTVDFLNSDDVLHNVFSPEKCVEKLNLGSWPKGQIRSYTFKQPGCMAVILCNVHPEMEAYIVVLETPYFAVSGKDGNFVIKNVPAGIYPLKIWHEKLKGELQTITVPESGAVNIDFTIKK